MNCCDLTLPTPAENLACDEVLLELCETGEAGELLRFWEPQQSFVVVGYGNKISTEANLPFCQQNGIPVLRRCTGGGAVLQAPGVLNYCLILRAEVSPCQTITATNQFVLKRLQSAMSTFLKKPAEVRGQSDLALAGLKFCGNSQRRKKRFLIFHGSFLLYLDFALVERTLPMPSKQPDYRLNRSHSEFLLNLEVPASQVKEALRKAWDAQAQMPEVPSKQIAALVDEKYSRREWNHKF
jgi:lipoate-protein ligase A